MVIPGSVYVYRSYPGPKYTVWVCPIHPQGLTPLGPIIEISSEGVKVWGETPLHPSIPFQDLDAAVEAALHPGDSEAGIYTERLPEFLIGRVVLRHGDAADVVRVIRSVLRRHGLKNL
jgi:hypothetical protein